MRDFLERLMERATEPAQVRPRAVGRFELGPWLDAGRTTTAAPAAADAADRRTELPRPPAQDAPRLVADAARGPVQREAVLAPSLAAPVVPATPPEPEAPPRSAAVRAPTRSKRRASGPVPEVAPARPAPAMPESPAGVRRRLQPEAVRLGAPLPVRPAPERRAPSATPDVVQVRIGRVEVRATMAREERPQVSRAPRARPLSLDAFLEGKRRP